MYKLEDILEKIESLNQLSTSDSFAYAIECSSLLKETFNAHVGRQIITNILDNWSKIPENTYEIWTDLIELAGFYPYLEKEKDNLKFKNTPGQIRKNLHFDYNLGDKYLHEEQKLLKEYLEKGKNLIVSAPTSFGKSLLIEDIVASRKYKNIVIIQPTLALLDETRRKLKKYSKDYKIIVRTSQTPSNNLNNIFLLTAERVLEYIDLPDIEFFVIDEFYKLSFKRDDERASILNNALNLLLRSNTHGTQPRFYLLGPNVAGISEGFTEKYNAVFYKTNYSLVDTKVFDWYTPNKDVLEKLDKQTKDGKTERAAAKAFKESLLFNKLLELNSEQTIIYCSSPARVRELANKFCFFLSQNRELTMESRLPLIDWIKTNIHEKWMLIECLNRAIGIHDGGLQKHITSSIIDYFNKGMINYLFCTTTIIEGVNTSAKNIIYFDKVKGKTTKIDYFDYSNIKGRAGRMMVHYIGHIHNFNLPPKEESVIVDIPFFEQDRGKGHLQLEILNDLRKDEINNIESSEYKELMAIPEEQRDLFRKNRVSIQGQRKILEEIADLDKQFEFNGKQYTVYELLNWKSPSFDQLYYCFDLCWRYLKNPRESLSIVTPKQLTLRVFNYSNNKNIKVLLAETFENYKQARDLQSERWHKRYTNKSNEELLNEATLDTFQLLRHWFEYKVPKWLSVMNELQKYVCIQNSKRSGSYTWFATQIENDFIQDNLVLLAEYGIPKSALDKISRLISTDIGEDEVIEKVKDLVQSHKNMFLDYEMEKVLSSLP